MGVLEGHQHAVDLHTELYKFAWNFLANNSRTVYHIGLRLGKIVYLLIFYWSLV